MEKQNRFSVAYAPSMIDLVVLMNEASYVNAKVIYFGPNVGKSFAYPDLDVNGAAAFIAVFDLAPTTIIHIDDLELIMSEKDEKDEKDTVLSA